MQIVFSEPTSGLTLAALSLKNNGGANLLTSSQTLTTTNHVTYTLGNLSAITGSNGTYTLKLTASGSGIADAAGNVISSDATTNFTLDTTAPTATITAISPNTRSSALSEMQIVFSEPVYGLTLSALSLNNGAGGNLLTSSQTLTTTDNITYTLGNLSSITNANGTFTLTVTASGSGVSDAAGNALSGNSSASFTISLVPPPEVTAVYVNSSAWQSSFLTFLGTSGLGSATLGYRIPGGANQLLAIPWVNVNIISVVFSQAVTINTSAAGLALVGSADLAAAPALSSATFSYNSTTHTATWTFRTYFALDKYMLCIPSAAVTNSAGIALDGEWTNGGSGASNYPSGNGTAGGNFDFRFNVLPCDVNQSGTVTTADGTAISSHYLYWTTTTGYVAYWDTTGKGGVTGLDYLNYQSALGTGLPTDDPLPPS